ncbi:hypothetical protein N7474_003681 [Penicillium riverlandense]|uniref:uncharacterized protein n=1 Tax=Penicillium riverlandense TaxID=1903569 RepID=UPI002548B6CE|nr:uncharacterized protein N7474_003681 [Penicillium riverlandense]KAJ5818090.1 hypothetical protein N7474_003681 [Penicillium riverlandense]
MPNAAVPQGSLPSEYWPAGLDPIFADQPPQSQKLPQSQQEPLAMSWDGPIFQQQRVSQLSDQNHDIYSSIPQSWQPNPLQQNPESRGYAAQYHPASQDPQYQQGSMSYDSRPLTPSESSAFPSYSFQQTYLPQHLSAHDSFPQQAARQQPPPQRPTGYRPIQPSYPGFQHGLLNNTIDLTANDYADPEQRIPQHNTINPQFLNSGPQAPTQQYHAPNNFLYVNPAEFERADSGKINFNYFQNEFSLQPQQSPAVNQPGPQGLSVQPGNPVPYPQVVIPTKKTVAKEQAPAKKTGTKTGTKAAAKKTSKPSSPASYTGSSDDSELEIEAPPEPSPIPPIRPTEPIAAAEYDTLQAVWSPRNKRASVDKVKSALAGFQQLTQVVRDTWKQKLQSMNVAENKGDNVTATMLKHEVVFQRNMMDKIVSTALEMGHPTVVEKLGEHPRIMAQINSFLADRFQAADFEGTFTLNLLRLLARFVTVDEELLQKTNNTRVVTKLVKKGGQAKELSQKILHNAAASTKRKQSNGKSTSKENSPTKSHMHSASVNGFKTEVAGSKRPREGEGSAQPAKRMVGTANTKTATATNGPAKRTGPSAQPGKSTTVAARPKANIIAPNPSSLFGSLSSASKKPGTTNAERKAAAAAAKPAAPLKKETTAPPPPRPPPTSLGDIMAGLDKPKEPEPVKPVEDQPPETEEERKKRLRKEARRKLRVTWKPDASLTEVRLFTHDPDEELGPGDGSMRGAGDVKGEGSVLKLHKNMDELEEEDPGLKETIFHEYHGLSEIVIESEDLKGCNFFKRHGNNQPTSPEKEAQEHRESTTLMVFYTNPAEIPPSPKEPPAVESEELAPAEVPFGELPDMIKARQERYTHVQPKPAPQSNTAAPGSDIADLLKRLGQPAPAAQQLAQQQQAPPFDLEKTVQMLSQQPQPLQAPQLPTFQPQGQGFDMQQFLGLMQGFMPSHAQQPQQAETLAGFGATLSQILGQNQQAFQQQSQSHGYEDPERKRMRGSNTYDDETAEQWSRQKRSKSGPMSHPKAGSVACRFWKDGMCRKGANCTFRHDN